MLYWSKQKKLFYFFSYLMDSNQSGYQLHQHDLHLKALLRAFQLSQQFLCKILMKADSFVLQPFKKWREINIWNKQLSLSSPWGSWMRWMAEKLNTSGFFFFLCFCPARIKTRLNSTNHKCKIRSCAFAQVTPEVPQGLSWPFLAFSCFCWFSCQWSIWPSGLELMVLPSE